MTRLFRSFLRARSRSQSELVLFPAMEGNKVSPATEPESKSNVSWCFQPFFVWMRFLGIELYHKCFGFRKFVNVYGVLLLLVCEWASIDFIAIKFWKISFPFRQQQSNNNALNASTSTTLSWNARIDTLNHFCFIAIVYPAFFYMAHHKWMRLWNAMETFDFAYCKLNYVRLRKILLIGFIPILLVSCAEIGIIVYNLMAKIPDFLNESSYRQFVTATAFFAKIVPISALVLYCSVVWLSSLFYEEIRLDMERTYKVNQENIRRWKCSLALAGEVVDRINDTFGLILLISITHFFVEFIARSFYLVNSISITNQPDVITLISIFSEVIFLWFVAYSPAKIHRQAIKVANSLRKMDTVDSNLQNQVSLLSLGIVQHLPKISALGHFDVSLHLIPQLIGTTLAYLFILYQFHASERHD